MTGAAGDIPRMSNACICARVESILRQMTSIALFKYGIAVRRIIYPDIDIMKSSFEMLLTRTMDSGLSEFHMIPTLVLSIALS